MTITHQDLSQLVDQAQRSGDKLVVLPRSFPSHAEMRSFYQLFGYITLKDVVR